MLNDLPLKTSGNLSGGHAKDWHVCGWFTPDYRQLAEQLAASLSAVGAPYHLWAKEKLSGGWDTRRKPSVVLETMDAYPGKTLILMDVDCIVRGDISALTAIDGDVGITVIARNLRSGSHQRHWIAVECSSRVVVFRPTEGARVFAQKWQRQIERSPSANDEHSMVWAFLTCSGAVAFSYIDQRYSGREISQLQDAVICHDSAHEKQKQREKSGLREMLKAIERRHLRTGRTKATKLRAEMSELLKSR